MNCQSNNDYKVVEDAADTKLSFQIFVLIGLVLVFIGRIQEVFGFLTPLRMGLVFQVLAIPVILDLLKKQQFSLVNKKAPEMKLLLLLFGYGFVAAAASSYLKASVNFMGISFFRNFMLFFLVVNIVRSAKNLRRLVWTYVLGITCLAVPAIFSHHSGRWSSLDGSYDANDLALLIVTTLPMVYCLIFRTKGLQRIVLFAALPILLVALVATGSRGGFLGLLAIIVLLFIRSRASLFKKAAIAGIVCLALFYFTPADYHERMSTIGAEEDYNATDSFGRLQIWGRSLDMIADNPVLGVGPGCFAIANGFNYAQEIGGAAWDMTAHNSLLLITAEMGIAGGGLYLAFILFNLNYMRKLQKLKIPELDDHIWFAKALEAALIGFLVSGFFLSFCYQPISYFLVGLGVAYRLRIAGLISKNPGCLLDSTLDISQSNYSWNRCS